MHASCPNGLPGHATLSTALASTPADATAFEHTLEGGSLPGALRVADGSGVGSVQGVMRTRGSCPGDRPSRTALAVAQAVLVGPSLSLRCERSRVRGRLSRAAIGHALIPVRH